jgi:hypothetical protein
MKRVGIFLLLASLSCTNNVGTNDEVLTGAHASIVIFEPDGKTPAEGATVKVFNANDESGQYVSVQTTDSSGRYFFKGLSKGNYNVWAEKDTLVTFQSSVIITSTDTIALNDTLSCASTITGFVGVQPQDDPRTVTVQVVGLDKYFKNTDNAGRFTMKNMAKGKYTLLLKSTLPSYTPTTAEIDVGACNAGTFKPVTLMDTLWMTFTGIPIVTGLSAGYDTLTGLVRLSWNPTDYRDLQAYLIYRDFYDSVVFSTNPCAARSDTFFIDPIYDSIETNGPFFLSDTNDYHFRYRVAIRNNVNVIGQTFRYVEIEAISPYKVKTSFSFSARHVAKGYVFNETIDTSDTFHMMITGKASINDSIILKARVSNPTHSLAQLTWRDGTGNVLRTIILDSQQKTAIDSISCIWPTLGMKYVTCTVTDKDSIKWVDTARVRIVDDIPTIKIFLNDSALINSDTMRQQSKFIVGDTIPFKLFCSDVFGTITTTEWTFGKNPSSAFERAVFDTFAIAPSEPTRFLITARVTDDDGNMASDSINISVIKASQ